MAKTQSGAKSLMTLGINTSSVKDGEVILKKAFDSIGDSMKAVGVAGAQFTRTGRLISATFKTISDDGRTATATMKSMTDDVVKYNEALKRWTINGTMVAAKNLPFSITGLRFDPTQNSTGNSQLEIGKRLAAMEELHRRAIIMDREYNAQRVAEEQRANDQSLRNYVRAQNEKVQYNKQMMRVQRQEFLRDWSAASQEDKDRNPKTFLDKIFNQASAIVTGIVLSQIFMRLTQEIFNAVKSASEFEIKISEIRTLSTKAQQSTNEWADSIKGLSDRFGAKIMDVAEGTYQTLSNQIAKGAETTAFMSEALKFSAVTMTSTVDAVNLLSAGINAYGKTAEDASGVAATFFKAVELGRIRAPELANSIGTVTAISSQLNIPLNEVVASLSVMTKNGVTAANAMTYMRNITTSLLKPSKEMKETMKEWGVSSGEMAIQTFGLVGVMQRLHEAIQKGGLEELAKDEPNIRGLIGTSLLSGTNIEKFKNEMKEFSDAMSGYSDKIGIAFESPGKKLQIFWNQLSNFFLTGFGEKFVNIAGTMAGWVGNIGDKLSFLTKVLEVGAVAWLTYKISMSGIGGFFDLIFNSVVHIRNAIIAMNALLYSNPWTLALTALVAIGTAIYIFSESSEAHFAKIMQKAKEVADDVSHYDLEWLNKREEKFKQSMEKQSQIVNEATAKIRASYTKEIETTEEKLKDLEEAVKESADLFKESFGESIHTIQDEMNKLKNMIRETESHMNSFAKTRDTKAFEHGIEDLSPFNRVKAEMARAAAIRQEAIQMKNDALDLIQRGDYEHGDEKLKSSRTLFDEALQLIDNAEKARKSTDKEKLNGITMDPLTKQNMLAQIIGHDKIHNEMLEREKKIKKDVETLDIKALELAREKSKFAQDELERNKQFKIVIFDQLKEVDKLKVTNKDTPDSIEKKYNKIVAAQDALKAGVIGGILDLGSAEGIFAKLEDKKNLMEQIFNKQQDLNQLNEKAKTIEEDKKNLQDKSTANFAKMKTDIEKVNLALAAIKSVFTTAGFNVDSTFNSALSPNAGIGEKLRVLQEMKKIVKDHPYMAGDENNDFINTQIKTGEFYIEDFMNRNKDALDLKKNMQVPGGTQGNAPTNNQVNYGDINIDIQTQPGQAVDVKQLAIEIRRQIIRGTVPAFA